jgi:hypothetical protein
VPRAPRPDVVTLREVTTVSDTLDSLCQLPDRTDGPASDQPCDERGDQRTDQREQRRPDPERSDDRLDLIERPRDLDREGSAASVGSHAAHLRTTWAVTGRLVEFCEDLGVNAEQFSDGCAALVSERTHRVATLLRFEASKHVAQRLAVNCTLGMERLERGGQFIGIDAQPLCELGDVFAAHGHVAVGTVLHTHLATHLVAHLAAHHQRFSDRSVRSGERCSAEQDDGGRATDECQREGPAPVTRCRGGRVEGAVHRDAPDRVSPVCGPDLSVL